MVGEPSTRREEGAQSGGRTPWIVSGGVLVIALAIAVHVRSAETPSVPAPTGDALPAPDDEDETASQNTRAADPGGQALSKRKRSGGTPASASTRDGGLRDASHDAADRDAR